MEMNSWLICLFSISVAQQFPLCNARVFIANRPRIIAAYSKSIAGVGGQSAECVYADWRWRLGCSWRQLKVQEQQHAESGALQSFALASHSPRACATGTAATCSAADTFSANHHHNVFGAHCDNGSATTTAADTSAALHWPRQRNKCHPHFAGFVEQSVSAVSSRHRRSDALSSPVAAFDSLDEHQQRNVDPADGAIANSRRSKTGDKKRN